MSPNLKNLMSIGYLCQTLQRSPTQISRVCKAAGIEPAMSINGVAHFGDEEFERIKQAFQERESK